MSCSFICSVSPLHSPAVAAAPVSRTLGDSATREERATMEKTKKEEEEKRQVELEWALVRH